jgi:TIR domain/PAN domain
MAGKIFINYRREDAPGTAGRLHDRLAQTFGRKNLFMDVDHIPAGVDFVEYLSSQVAECDVFLAVIGPNWLDSKDDDGRRRFDNPDDFVTIEITAALARKIRVIPVLVDGARTPKADKLPDSVKPLVRRNAVEVRNTHFGRDAEALASKLREALQDARPVKKRWPFLASAAAWFMEPRRWRMAAWSATALLLVGWVGLYQIGMPVWMPWAEQPEAKLQRLKKVAADAETKLKAAEAEQQQFKEEEQRQAKAAADADAKRKVAEDQAKLKASDAELQRLRDEVQRQTKMVAEADTKRKAAEAEQQRMSEQIQRQTRAVADAEAKLKAAAAEAEQQRLAAVKAEEERKPPSPAGLFTMRTNTEAIGSPPVDGKPVSSIGECEQSCTQSATCKIFTFRKSTAMCYTYSDATFMPSDYFDTGIRK